MKQFKLPLIGFGLAFALAGCNQAGTPIVAEAPQNAAPIVASDPEPQGQRFEVAAVSAPTAQPVEQAQPPIYEPLVDMNGKNPQRYARDHAACRQMAAPQERVAREAMQREQAGAALQVAGAVASFIPVGSFRAAANLANGSALAQEVGANVQGANAQTGAAAREDYALVVNNCLSRRGYYLLRT